MSPLDQVSPLSEMNNNSYIFIIFDNISVLLSYWDKDNVCRFANKAYSEWFGKEISESSEKLSFRKLIGNSSRIRLAMFDEVLQGKIIKFRQSYLSPAGIMTPCLITIKPYWLNNLVQGFTVQIIQVKDSFIRNVDELVSNENLLMEKVGEHIRQHIFTPFIGIQDLSKLHFISSAKLKRDFKKLFDTTPFAYYRELQMKFAEHQITNNLASKKELAAQLNFSNPSNFYQCYKRFKQKSKLL